MSERVKAGQKISRDNGTIYGNGNILGYDYDKVNRTYAVNPDQAETVRIMFDLYLHSDMGCAKIANELTVLRRKNASGEVQWTSGIISRVLRNATYMGYNVYYQSFSNNYLEQRRVINTDKASFQFVKADFEPLVSEADWRQCEVKRNSRIAETRGAAPGQRSTHAKREPKDVWLKKLCCDCGSSFRRNRWHKNKYKEWSYGYICYNQVNNGSARRRREAGLDDDGYCDMQTLAEWKMDAMGKLLLATLWGERREAVQLACQMLRDCACDEPAEQGGLKRGVLSQIAKAEKKIENLIEMRAEGEISKEEFLRQRAKLDGELKALQAELQAEPEATPWKTEGLAWKAIEDTLNQLIDFSGPALDKKLYEKLVSKVIPRNNNRFAWVMNLDNGVTAEYTLVTEGRKASQKVSLADPEGDNPSLHQIGVIYLADFIQWRKEPKNSPAPFPLRRPLAQGRRRLYFELTIDSGMARAFRKAAGGYLRENQWQDITVEVYI